MKAAVVSKMSSPDDHFASPYCRVIPRAEGALVGLVAVQLFVPGSYLPPVLKRYNWRLAIESTPDDHFTAGPHCRVTPSGSGRIGGAGSCPSIRTGIVSPASGCNHPPHTIISLPVQTALCKFRAPSAFVGLVAVQLFVRDCISRRCSNY